MVHLFKHLVKATVGSLLVAITLRWYASHQGTLADFVRRLQGLAALIQASR